MLLKKLLVGSYLVNSNSIQKKLNITQQTAIKYIKELKQLGYIKEFNHERLGNKSKYFKVIKI